jgi:hypothetical protein
VDCRDSVLFVGVQSAKKRASLRWTVSKSSASRRSPRSGSQAKSQVCGYGVLSGSVEWCLGFHASSCDRSFGRISCETMLRSIHVGMRCGYLVVVGGYQVSRSRTTGSGFNGDHELLYINHF